MRWTQWTPLISCSLALAVAVPLIAAAPAAPDAKAKRIKRGEYLTTVCSCGDCHTPGTFYGSPDFDRKLSGSEMGWRGPWGVSYARNLTPDRETGIGAWTEKQIVDAMRTGMRPDGRVLNPPMPWQNLTAFTDEDAYSIAAYLKSLPPISHKVPAVVPPDQAAGASGSVVDFPPPPSAWDAPRPAPGGGASGSPAK